MSLYEFVTENETTIRLSFFLGVLLIMAIWEIIAPRRALTVSKAVRWANNLGLVFLNTFTGTSLHSHLGCLTKNSRRRP